MRSRVIGGLIWHDFDSNGKHKLIEFNDKNNINVFNADVRGEQIDGFP